MKLPNLIWSICLFVLPLLMVHTLIDVVTIPRLSLLLLGIASSGFLLLKNEKKAFLEHSQQFFGSLLGQSLFAYLLIGLVSLWQANSLPDAKSKHCLVSYLIY